MSDRFFELARQEMQSEIDSLQIIFESCRTDQQCYERAEDIEKHMHKIKGLAPMMGEEEIGKIARTSDIIVKHVIKQGILKGSHAIIFDSVQKMHHIFNGQADAGVDDFERHAKKTFPEIADI